jgi:hypothetical protein
LALLSLKFVKRLAVTLVINAAASENLLQVGRLTSSWLGMETTIPGADKDYMLGVSPANKTELPFKDLAVFLAARERQIR